MAWFIGLMSGTSLDGVDAVLAQIDVEGHPRSHAHAHRPFLADLRDELLALNRSGPDEIHRAALAANGVSEAYAGVVADLLKQSTLAPEDIQAVGAHGQTVRHRPQAFDSSGYTVQLLNGALLAELTRIDVVCDFRNRDLAAGGQGAPLVPAFHAACFALPGQDIAALNLGGIANLTLLGADGSVRGFDSGPANVLMDGWMRRHSGRTHDAGGAWAATGRVDTGLLDQLLAEPYFALLPPKSTGRDLFDMAWLDTRLAGLQLAAQDVMATLCELSARTVAQALRSSAPFTTALHVCGGGAFNTHLMGRLQALLPDVRVRSSMDSGIAPDQVEALAFACLAHACVQRRVSSLPQVTGARGARVLGAIYPAG